MQIAGRMMQKSRTGFIIGAIVVVGVIILVVVFLLFLRGDNEESTVVKDSASEESAQPETESEPGMNPASAERDAAEGIVMAAQLLVELGFEECSYTLPDFRKCEDADGRIMDVREYDQALLESAQGRYILVDGYDGYMYRPDTGRGYGETLAYFKALLQERDIEYEYPFDSWSSDGTSSTSPSGEKH